MSELRQARLSPVLCDRAHATYPLTLDPPFAIASKWGLEWSMAVLREVENLQTNKNREMHVFFTKAVM